MKNRTNLLIILGGALAVFSSWAACAPPLRRPPLSSPPGPSRHAPDRGRERQPINTNARVTGALDKSHRRDRR
jgi:hypothetical protein